MQINSLLAINPIDGRYRKQSEELANYFSEYALIKNRIKVEIEYFIFLSEKKIFSLSSQNISQLRLLTDSFSLKDAEQIKTIEKTTNHDVKAVEYFLKEKLQSLHLSAYTEWIHFGLTSQDINNTAFPLMWKEFLHTIYFPKISAILKLLSSFAKQWATVPMLAYTHGQPASPTLLGKELMVFVERLNQQLNLLKQIPITAKFGGATGNLNAHYGAFPSKNWHKLADEFVEKKLKLKRQRYTTQIEHYDFLAASFDNIKRINTILIDFCRDMWMYISMEYFKQKIKENEVGSSAMPHKVNPIDFENAEGNLVIANSYFEFLSAKLPISRLQRDLTDSTVIRNIGVPAAHSIIALNSIEKGCGKLLLNKTKLQHDLESNWAVVAEAIQTILRRENYPKPYEALKQLTRNNEQITKEKILCFIDELKISDKIKSELKKITPHNYTGKMN